MIDETTSDVLGEMVQELYELYDYREREGLQMIPVDQEPFNEEFAKVHRWRIGREFSIEQLKRGTMPSRTGEKKISGLCREYDHVAYFRKNGRPVGFITHAYCTPDEVLRRATADGLHCRILVRSWYYPRVATAALITPIQ